MMQINELLDKELQVQCIDVTRDLGYFSAHACSVRGVLLIENSLHYLL